jgi:RNA recognition motif-containing protein
MAQPSQTLYVQNLGEGLKTAGDGPSLNSTTLDSRCHRADLKRNLYHLFSNHGKVLDVVASRAKGMKGQAFVVFQEMAAATAARRREDGNPFLGKRMVSPLPLHPPEVSSSLDHSGYSTPRKSRTPPSSRRTARKRSTSTRSACTTPRRSG